MTQRPEDAEGERASAARAAEEAEAAAEEAGNIGGPDPMPGADPEQRPLAEGGEGEAEGFEQAEDALVRQASHEDNPSDPQADAFEPEAESDRSTADYGDPDGVDDVNDATPAEESEG